MTKLLNIQVYYVKKVKKNLGSLLSKRIALITISQISIAFMNYYLRVITKISKI